MELLTAIYNAIMAFTNMVWSLPLLILLIGGGLWITFTCDFVQIKHFGYMMKYTFGSMTNKGTEGQISPIQAMFATLANTIGTGNIIGVAVSYTHLDVYKRQAYILYTSGSTGAPKGVAVQNRNVCHYIQAFQSEFHPDEQDTVLQYSVCSFDIFVEEVFSALLSGALLAIP